MDPFDRYIRVLRLFLPRAERHDIISELREEYCSQVADQERRRGRRLTDAERRAITRQFGHPLATAARYWRRQHLIGPAFFPFYWPAVATVLVLNVVLHAVSAAVAFALRQSMTEVFSLADDLWPSTFMLIGIVTVVFAVLERVAGNPNAVVVQEAQRAARGVVRSAMNGVAPALEMTEAMVRPLGPHGPRPVGDPQSPPAKPSFAGLMVSIVFVAWWLLALRIPSLMFLAGGSQLAWAPAMDRIYPSIAAANLLFLASECLRQTSLRNSAWTRLLGIAAVLADVVFLSMIITSDYHWVIWQAAPQGGRETDLIGLLNVVLTGVMLAVAFGVTVRWLKSIGRRLTARPPRTAVA
jgi:hypothetical protein